MKLTIVEGPDGSGKSVLAKELAHRYHARLVHHGPYAGEVEIEQRYLDSFDWRKSRIPHVVLDRSWISEPLYGKVYRNTTRIAPEQERMLVRCALACEAVVVLCLPPYETCRRNLDGRDKDAYLTAKGEDRFRRLYDGYRRLTRATIGLPTMWYDYDSSKITEVDDLMKHLDFIRPPRNEGPGVGRFQKGGVLLVGERCNVAKDGPALPFVSWRTASSATWLTQRILYDTTVTEEDLYWINAFAPDGTETSTDDGWVDKLQPKLIIALGNVAAAWCSRHVANGRHVITHAPHPQYWKRFHLNDPGYSLLNVLNTLEM